MNNRKILERWDACSDQNFREMIVQLGTEEIIVDIDTYGVQASVRVKFGIAHHHELIHLDDQQHIHEDCEMIVQFCSARRNLRQ